MFRNLAQTYWMKLSLTCIAVLLGSLCFGQDENLFVTSPEAEAFYQKAMPVINPRYKTVIDKMATSLNGKNVSADSAKSLMQAQHSGSVASLSEMDIETLVMLTLIKIDKDNQQDLKAMLRNMKQQNASKKNQTQPVVYKEKTIKKDSITERQTQLEKQKETSRTEVKELGEAQQMRMQLLMDRRSKALETISNIMKKISSTQDSIINNLK